VAKPAIRHFFQAAQKKVAKLAKPALPLLPPFFQQVSKNRCLPKKTGFTAFTGFFLLEFRKYHSFFSVSLAGRGRSLLTKIHTQTARDCDRTSRIPAAMPRNLRAVSCPK
jgi:hypothetical protein